MSLQPLVNLCALSVTSCPAINESALARFSAGHARMAGAAPVAGALCAAA